MDFFLYKERNCPFSLRDIEKLPVSGTSCIVGNPNRKKMHIFGFVGIFEYIC